MYYGLNACPECGLNFYLPQEDEWQETWTAEQPDSGGLTIGGVSLAGVIFGWLFASLVLFAFQLLGKIEFLSEQSLYITLLFLGSGIFAGFVGGYLAGWLSNDKHLFAAAIVGLLTVLTSVIIEGFWRDLASEALLNLRVILTWIAILLAAFGGGLIIRNRALRVDDALFGDEEELYHKLMVKIGYDRSLAERLINYERHRTPKATRVIWIRSAITRWERDNRL